MEPTDTIITLMAQNEAGDTKAVNVHRGLLCTSSAFFRRALKPEWTELKEKPDVIDLSDDSVQTVSDYVKYLYSDNIAIKLYKAGEEAREKVAEEAEKVFVMLAQAYVFGEKIDDARYKNAVVKTVIEAKKSSNWNMGPESVDIIYKNTPTTSPLRHLVADTVANLAHDDSNKEIGWMTFFDAYPREALVDALKATVKARPSLKSPTYRTLDTYLEEEKDEEREEEEEEEEEE